MLNYKNLQYENVFRGKFGALYARLYNKETNTVETKSIKVIPSIYINDQNPSNNTNLISIPEKKPLKQVTFKTMKDYRDTFNLYKGSNVPMYGNKSQEQTFIRENWPKPMDSYHEFSNMWFWDIEVGNGIQQDIEVEMTEEDYRLAIKKGII
jgi:hypothetical protein